MSGADIGFTIIACLTIVAICTTIVLVSYFKAKFDSEREEPTNGK